jgi:hypothetical protein
MAPALAQQVAQYLEGGEIDARVFQMRDAGG